MRGRTLVLAASTALTWIPCPTTSSGRLLCAAGKQSQGPGETPPQPACRPISPAMSSQTFPAPHLPVTPAISQRSTVCSERPRGSANGGDRHRRGGGERSTVCLGWETEGGAHGARAGLRSQPGRSSPWQCPCPTFPSLLCQ